MSGNVGCKYPKVEVQEIRDCSVWNLTKIRPTGFALFQADGRIWRAALLNSVGLWYGLAAGFLNTTMKLWGPKRGLEFLAQLCDCWLFKKAFASWSYS